ncbi:hypothetical protein BDZ89DRAFT_1126161 [Hymenopellis radicata]|nr:hypothetical protein BDZ89DRAFT_1126161 [Hymenopellis radicata]
MKPFLDGITLPQLHTLNLDPRTFPSTSLRDLFTRSTCRITALNLHICWPETPYGEAQNTLVATQASALVDCLKVEEVRKHLSRLTIIVRQNNSYSHRVIPLPLLELLAESPHLPTLTYLRFTASSGQAPLIKQLLANRVTNYDENHFVKLEALTLHLSGGGRSRGCCAFVDVDELELFEAEVVELLAAELVILALEPDAVVVAEDVPEAAEPDVDTALLPDALPLGRELPDARGGPATVNVKDPKTVSTPDCPLGPTVISSPPTRDTLVT